VAGYSLRQIYQLDETAESFDEAKQENFKQKLVDALNANLTGITRLTISAVDLVVAVGASSLEVRTVVTAGQPTLVSQVQLRMNALARTAPDQLSALLGVDVVAAPSAVEQSAITTSESMPENDSGGGGGGDDVLIVSIAVAAVAVMLVVALGVSCAVCACKNKVGPFRSSAPPVAKATAFTHGEGGKAVAHGRTPL